MNVTATLSCDACTILDIDKCNLGYDLRVLVHKDWEYEMETEPEEEEDEEAQDPIEEFEDK